MNGKQLKNSILQWAIQGKLVPQDPNDEPASVLLERIRAEKARLVKEKKIKKDKNESIIYRGDDNSVYELLRKSILQEAIQGKLVPQIAEEGSAQELLEQIKAEKQKLVKEGKLKKSALATSVIFRGDDNKYYELY